MLVLMLLLISLPTTSYANKEISLGLGIGSQYSGIGINAAKIGNDYMGYLAIGCLGIGYSEVSGWILPCGVGAGWIWTDLFTKANNKHGLGLYVGPASIDKDIYNDDKARYGLGVTYVYFPHGLNSRGLNVGVTPVLWKENGETQGGLMGNIGYQF